VCIQSTCTQSVICHVVCYAQPQKATILLFILPPTRFLIFPATTAAFVWLPSTYSYCWAFYAISVCFCCRILKKTKTLQNLCPCIVFFPLTPHTYWPLLSNSYLSVFTCQRIKPTICAYFWLSLAVKTLKKSEKCTFYSVAMDFIQVTILHI